MMPDTTPFKPPAATGCADCDAALVVTRYRCPACIRAAELAASRRAHGAVVRPSDVAAARQEEDEAS